MSLLAAIVCQAPDGGTGGLGADGFNDVLLLLLVVGGGRHQADENKRLETDPLHGIPNSRAAPTPTLKSVYCPTSTHRYSPLRPRSVRVSPHHGGPAEVCTKYRRVPITVPPACRYCTYIHVPTYPDRSGAGAPGTFLLGL